jgi:hypothetical protein
MPTMDKCFLDGASKIKRIMSGSVYICRHCGLSYDKFLQADRCCAKNLKKKKEAIQNAKRI